MNIDTDKANILLREQNFEELLRTMGWDNFRKSHNIVIEESTFTAKGLAEKRGMKIFLILNEIENYIPERLIRKKISKEISKFDREHILIFVDNSNSKQLWSWTSSGLNRPDLLYDHPWIASAGNYGFFTKLEIITFEFEEESFLTLPEVLRRTEVALKVESVTSTFYKDFTKNHEKLLLKIEGISDEVDQKWYASLILNRLMFVYFIQKKGFLDNNLNYLRDKLNECIKKNKNSRFYSFYKKFLLVLFHEGLNKYNHDSSVKELLGKIPYLNGGLFERHQLELKYPEIEISNDAFEFIFSFFERYQWYLEERPNRLENEINPDVLGHIFEKYINQRESGKQKDMGAYYTNDDITKYISENTIIPNILDSILRTSPDSNSKIFSNWWQLLKNEPNRFIKSSLKYGVEIPYKSNFVENFGIVMEKNQWVQFGDKEVSLENEMVGDVIHRRKQYHELIKCIQSNKVTTVNDLITYNLDINQFAQDVIKECDDPALIWKFWCTLKEIRILDPTCGSGAFLFAALNVLQKLYECCLSQMEEIIVSGAGSDYGQSEIDLLNKILCEWENVKQHPSIEYFILKCIILNNLYGVDIMEEAVEVCKLRLFLKLAAQVNPDIDKQNLGIEPLPDIDFNVRTGNTLVGITNVDEIELSTEDTLDSNAFRTDIIDQVQLSNEKLNSFRDAQTERNIDTEKVVEIKKNINDTLDSLGKKINEYFATKYNIDTNDKIAFCNWEKTHRPFHWFIEFNHIMADGGFDVIIGNPPYVDTSKFDYLKRNIQNRFPNIYGHVLRKSINLNGNSGRCGMIVPLSITSHSDFKTLREDFLSYGSNWFSSFDIRPGSLFSGAEQRCTIWISGVGDEGVFSTHLHRWRTKSRPFLIDLLKYISLKDFEIGEAIPKLGHKHICSLVHSLNSSKGKILRKIFASSQDTKTFIGYSQTARNYISVFSEFPPCFNSNFIEIPNVQRKLIQLKDDSVKFSSLSSLSGSVFFSFWLTYSGGFNLPKSIIEKFLMHLSFIQVEDYQLLVRLGEILDQRRLETLVFQSTNGKFVSSNNYRSCKDVTVRADLILMKSLDLNIEEALGVINEINRILSVNTQAGEKGIPNELREQLQIPPRDLNFESDVFKETDRKISSNFDLKREKYKSIIDKLTT